MWMFESQNIPHGTWSILDSSNKLKSDGNGKWILTSSIQKKVKSRSPF